VYETFYLAYEPDTEKRMEEYEAKRKQVEAEFTQKTLDQRRSEFWDLCKSFGCREADIQKQWDEYLRN
jgi:hypothetical protein